MYNGPSGKAASFRTPVAIGFLRTRYDQSLDIGRVGMFGVAVAQVK